MTTVNGVTVPTCSELAEMLKFFGDKPLFTGGGWFAACGFRPTEEGVQLYVQKCAPAGRDAKTRG